MHHIDYNKDNCAADNLITLCATCHGKTNGDRAYWERQLKGLMVLDSEAPGTTSA